MLFSDHTDCKRPHAVDYRPRSHGVGVSTPHDYTRCAPKSVKKKKQEESELVFELTLIWFLDFGQFAGRRALWSFTFKNVVGLSQK